MARKSHIEGLSRLVWLSTPSATTATRSKITHVTQEAQESSIAPVIGLGDVYTRRTMGRLLKTGIGALMVIGVIFSGTVPAWGEGETIKGTLEVISDEGREPVGGARITVSQGGEVIGEADSDDAGDWEIAVPGPGDYVVTLDVGSLPEGVALTDPEAFELENVNVRASQNKTVRFNLGPGLTSGVSTWERVSSLFVVGLKLGAVIALGSIGLSLIFGVTGLVNFAHGELLTVGAVLALFFNASTLGPRWHILIAAVPAILIVAAFGGGQERWLWRPLRHRGTGLIAMIVVSIGMSFALRYVALLAIGGLPSPYLQYAVQRNFEFLGITTVPKNIIIIIFTVVVLTITGLFLLRTKLGTAMRAVSDNPNLAESSGIDVERVIWYTWVIGAGLAALGGIMLGISEQVSWDMGFRLLLLIFAAVILGGLGTAFGAMVGGFIVGVAVEMSTLWIPPEFKTAVGLGILIVMLLIRPQGILGSKERIG